MRKLMLGSMLFLSVLYCFCSHDDSVSSIPDQSKISVGEGDYGIGHDTTLFGQWFGRATSARQLLGSQDSCIASNPLLGICIRDTVQTIGMYIDTFNYQTQREIAIYYNYDPNGASLRYYPGPICAWFSRNDSIYMCDSSDLTLNIDDYTCYRYHVSKDTLYLDNNGKMAIYTRKQEQKN